MIIDGWKYYNHAAVPVTAPHEKVNLEPLLNGSIWQIEEGLPLLARWHTDWDLESETNWWFVILDKPFDIKRVKSHARTRIRKGLKTFTVRRISSAEFAEGMAYVTLKDWESYPQGFCPKMTRAELVQQYKNWNYITYGAFDATGLLCAFHCLQDCGSYYQMVMGKSVPDKQRGQLNAALIYTFITDLAEDIARGKYLSNGARNLNHQTNFNDDLCKYYGFRRVYCILHLKYRKPVALAVRLLYPARRLVKKVGNWSYLLHRISAVLEMEEIRRMNEKLRVP